MAVKISEQLHEFIAQARAGGKSDSDIKAMLLNSGWDENAVTAALTPAGDLVPPPPPAPKSSGREIFFYLLQFFTLGTAAVSLGGVVFALINHYFTDEVVAQYYQPVSSVTSALAALIVALPVFAAVSWKLIRDAAAGRTSVRSGIRRVITYLALFLASATVIGDVIALVYRFLAGEPDERFLLKIAVILIIGGWVIWYYYVTVKRDERGVGYPAHWHSSHAIALAVVFVIVAVGGFMLSGTPQERQRLVRDQQRVQELQNISWQVQTYYDREQALPVALADVNSGYVPQEPADPLTGAPYQYLRGQGLAYQLCATFETDDKQVTTGKSRIYLEPMSEVNWTHPAGEHCFDLEVTPRTTP
ncbi:MAG: DUF5671 domain-containing protein [Candidatus Veblenbacteria bacterium]|nr:DUF5671 domain-containing protein [Candidatus Veblenbacteria bacterium]MDZ4229663.1 DUF5671 domain-containing protein [Candidatus Veblenbacteria bacterium]